MPSTLVFTRHSWYSKPAESEEVVTRRLQKIDPAFPRESITFLLFDEGQDTYSDFMFWNSFIKEVGDGIYPYYRVILFCSYGHPSSRPVDYDIGSPPVLRAAARISLWPVEGASPGILLQWFEFMEVVSRFERPLNVHPDLVSLIFEWTVGHVGAVIELLRVISYLVSLSCQPQLLGSLISAPQKVSETRHGEQFTVQDFYDEIPVHVLVRRLDAGAFQRGLPREFPPDFGALFRRLLKDRKVEIKEGETDETVIKVHGRGWIYATMIPRGVRYTFPSPLHEACLSGSLNLGTTCLFPLPPSRCLSRSSPSSGRLSYNCHPVVLVLHPRTHPKHNIRMNTIILFWLPLSGMFISLPSMHLHRQHMLRVVSTSSFQSWNGVLK